MAGRRSVFAIAARRFNNRIFGEQTSYLRGLIHIAKRYNMTAYVFSPLDIDWKRKRIKAYVPGKSGWKVVHRPFPDVVHDRLWGLGEAKAQACRDSLRRLEEEFGVPVFNPDFGDKLDVHVLLSRDEQLAPHLPETLPLDAQAIERLGARHRVLFIKPLRGRQGTGITKAQKADSGWKAARQLKGGGAVKRSLADARELLEFAAATGDSSEFLVQQGLELVRAGRSAVDIRAIVQRDKNGRWRVSAIGARVGRPGGFVSNLHAGGKAISLSALSRRLPRSKRAARLEPRIRALALRAADQMATAHPKLGELGLDLGLDGNRKLWILEVNRQPGRALFSRARLLRPWRTSRIRVVQYARYLVKHRHAQVTPKPKLPLEN